MELFNLAKSELLRSNSDRKHPFRLMSFATLGTTFPELRTVVKRHVNNVLEILFYTDSRTPKVGELLKNEHASILLYNPKKSLQLRVKAIAEIVEPTSILYNEHFAVVKNIASIKDYQSLNAPGSILKATQKFADEINFCLIKLVPQEIDILKLGKENHQRASYVKVDDKWVESLLVP